MWEAHGAISWRTLRAHLLAYPGGGVKWKLGQNGPCPASMGNLAASGFFRHKKHLEIYLDFMGR
jgi:hypothetical protein